MMQSLGDPATDSLIVHVDGLLEDLIPEFLEHRKEDVEAGPHQMDRIGAMLTEGPVAPA